MFVDVYNVVLHLTEDSCSLKAVGQETEEAVVSISDTHSNRPAPRNITNVYVGISKCFLHTIPRTLTALLCCLIIM